MNRIHEHKVKKHSESFTAKYNISKLVYYERFESIGEAIKPEKQLKAGSRDAKIRLINEMNPDWINLSEFLIEIE